MMGKAITSLMMAFVTLCLYAQERQQDVDSVGQTNVIVSGYKVPAIPPGSEKATADINRNDQHANVERLQIGKESY